MSQAVLLLIFALSAVSAEETQDCLRKCVTPLAKLDRSFSHVFNNFEKVCDLLESGAFCIRKCSKEDQNKFHQYTTFYRIHCIDYEEEIEPHLDCLKEAAKDIDDVCSDRCKSEHPLEKDTPDEEKQKQGCLSLECSTICYFQEFVEDCPNAKNALLKLNIGQIHSIAQTIHPLSFEKMDQTCRNVHNTDYMKIKMLGDKTEL